VYVQIEADFMVTYRLQAEIEDPALSAFSNFNAVHNVWPFWRQHVFDIVQRGELPNIEVPLFAGTKS
jgi:preprotein translocase subunit SecB